MESEFLPEKIITPDLTDYDEWSPEGVISQINKCSKRIQKLKPAVEDVIMLFWTAHEKIVNKHEGWEDWTWGGFCEECGYSSETPRLWFNKYGLSYSRTSKGGERVTKNLVGNRSPEKSGEDKPLRKHTNPEVKEKLTDLTESIKSGEVSTGDLKKANKTINQAIDKTEKNKERQKEFKNNFPTKSRIRKLNDKMAEIIDELTYLADETIEEEGGDSQWIKAIRMKGPGFILQFHKLGVDLNKVYTTLINPKKELGHESEREEREERDAEEGVIDITPGEDP